MSYPTSITMREVPDGLVQVLAAGDAFNLKTIKMTIEQSLEVLVEVKAAADAAGAQLAERILGRERPGQVMKAGKRTDLAVA